MCLDHTNLFKDNDIRDLNIFTLHKDWPYIYTYTIQC